MDSLAGTSLLEEGRPFSEVHARQLISRIGREELEDKYLRLQEENLDLKKYARKQEEKIKKMATKLLRLVHDKKKKEASDGGGSSAKDVDSAEKIADFQARILELEKQNSGLKNKLMVAKQQLQTHGKRPTPYDHVKPKINTGTHARTPSGDRRLRKDLRVQGRDMRPGTRVAPPMLPQPRYGHSLLEEARLEKRELEEFNLQLQEQIQILEEDKDRLRAELKEKQLQYEDEILLMRDQLSGAQRANIQENVDLIKLQREMKDKATALQAVQAKYTSLEENLNKVKANHANVLEQMETLNEQFKEEQRKNLILQNELKTGGIASKSSVEQLQLISDLKAENEILKEANEKLVNSAFDGERERMHRAKQRQLEVEQEQMRATLRSELQEKNDILDKLTSERESAEKLQEELRELRVQHYTLREQHDELREKMKFFTKESAVDFQEIEEALVLVKRRKERGSQDLDFLEKVDDELNRDLKQQIQELQAGHADTINELEKTRNMLIIQHKINKDYQHEVERVTRQMNDEKKEYDLKMREYAQLLDIRADRIRKLESQMRDIAYGTKQYKALPAEDSEYEEADSIVELERGQNVFEIHIGKLIISKEAAQEFGEEDPMTFVTIEFFEHEIQTTPVVKGSRPEFNFTSQYLIRVDDFFLHYLQKESSLVELHRAFGTDYQTVAACQLKFRDLLEKPHGRIHGSAKLIGCGSRFQGADFATLEYWVRLRVPMDQAIRLYRERTKALGYMSSDAYTALEDAGHAQQAPSDINELAVHVIRCAGLKPRRAGVQPCPYVVYRFYDFADHDSDIIQSSNAPEFNDVRSYPVPMSQDLDSYLRAAHMEVYVFDDADPEPTAYLGLAKVPLISLANDKPIKGTFELRKASGEVNGTLDVFLKWKYTYLPASAKPKRPAQRPMMEPSDELSATTAPTTPKVARAQQKAFTSPFDSSTPKQEKPEQTFVPVEPPPAPPKLKRKAESKEQLEAKEERHKKEKPLEEMSLDELAAAADETPKAPPRKKSHDLLEKPIEDMSVDEMMEAAGQESPQPQAALDAVSETGSWDDEKEDEKLVAEEMRRTTEAATEDTLFEEEHVSEDSTIGEEVEIPVAKESEDEGEDEQKDEETSKQEEAEEDKNEQGSRNVSEQEDEEGEKEEEGRNGDDEEEEEQRSSWADQEISEAETSESEGLVMSPRTVARAASAAPPCDTVTIQIGSLTLHPEAPVLQDPSVQQLFVSYRFLDYEPADLETPMTLPKPAAFRPISFNFKKVFHVDNEKNALKRDNLKRMLAYDSSLVFTVVSEPNEEEEEDGEEGDCLDIATASVDFLQLLQDGKDLVDADLELYDVTTGEQGSVVGSLTVTVEAVDALRSLYDDP